MARISNSVTLVGRIVRDIETRAVGDTQIASFAVAVDRPKGKDGQVQTDFVNCQAWGTTAEFIQKYLGKGRKVALQGELRVDTYNDKNGDRKTSTNVRVDSIEFADSKSAEKTGSESGGKKYAKKPNQSDEKMPWDE